MGLPLAVTWRFLFSTAPTLAARFTDRREYGLVGRPQPPFIEASETRTPHQALGCAEHGPSI